MKKSVFDPPKPPQPTGLLYDGSSLNVDEKGNGVFVFPDGESRLVGTWDVETLQMKCAVFGDKKESVYEFEGAFPGRHPLLPCPYESQYVAVRQSTLTGAGEGLFATKPLREGLVVSYYTGAEIALSDVYRRSWSENANVILLDENESYGLDAMRPWDETQQFCAALGHKVNHSVAKQNCKYANAYHPRFGHISSIVTTRAVESGEELFVDYQFNEHWDLPWFAENSNNQKEHKSSDQPRVKSDEL